METLEHRIVKAARGWVGTRFHHQGRLKRTDAHNGGVDCLGLLIGVARELSLVGREGVPLAALDNPDYPHFPDGQALKASLARHLYPVGVYDIPYGGIALMALDGVPRHLGIIAESQGQPTLIHAYAQARKVVEQQLDGWWRERVVGIYTLNAANVIKL